MICADIVEALRDEKKTARILPREARKCYINRRSHPSRPGLGAQTLDEGVVGMGLAVIGAMIASQKHDRLPDTRE
jgi:hypothetical protein